MSAFSCCCDWGFEFVKGTGCEITYTTACPQFPIAPGMSSSWDLAVAGITNTFCTNCTNLNGMFTLDIQSGCSFRTAFFNLQATTSCTPTANGHWQLNYTDLSGFGGSGTNWGLLGRTSLGGAFFVYELNGTFDPDGPNTFDLIFDALGGCGTAPLTLTIEPTCA